MEPNGTQPLPSICFLPLLRDNLKISQGRRQVRQSKVHCEIRSPRNRRLWKFQGSANGERDDMFACAIVTARPVRSPAVNLLSATAFKVLIEGMY